MKNFHKKCVKQKLVISDDYEGMEVTKIANLMGKLPDKVTRGTEYLDGYALEWQWLASDGWILERVHTIRTY